MGTIEFIRSRCLRSRHASSSCKRCIDSCPRDALFLIDGKIGVKYSACSACAACASCCPQEVFVATKPSDKKFMALCKMATFDQKLILSCKQNPKAQIGEPIVNCLQRLDASYFVTFATLNIKQVELNCGSCNRCFLLSKTQTVENHIKRAEALLTSLGFNLNIKVIQHEPNVDLKKRSILISTVNLINERHQDNLVETYKKDDPWRRIPSYQVRLIEASHKTVRSLQKIKQDIFHEPTINTQKCTGCTVCVVSCPTGALFTKKENGRLDYFLSPSICTGCGLCKDVCYTGALELKAIEGINVLLNPPIKLQTKSFDPKGLSATWEDKLGSMFGDVPIYKT